MRLAVIPEGNKLQWLSQTGRKYQEGDVVISFVPPEEKSKAADAKIEDAAEPTK